MGIIHTLWNLADTGAHGAEPELVVYCIDCRSVRVKREGDLCPACARCHERGYRSMTLTGRCANGAQRDRGTRVHAVPLEQCKALYGAQPRGRSRWSEYGWGGAVTCNRCQQRLARQNAASAAVILPLIVAGIPWPVMLSETDLLASVARILLALLIPLWLFALIRLLRHGYLFGPAPAVQYPGPQATRHGVSVPPAWSTMVSTHPAARAQRERTAEDIL